MMKPTPVIAALVVAVACSTFAFAAPTNQVMFEGNGTGTFNSRTVPFSFSIHCYGTNCVGAVSMGNNNSTYVSGTVTQVQQETYMMSVSSGPPSGIRASLAGPANMSCSLVNTPPIVKGGGNTVTITCSSPAGSGTSTDALVEALP